MSSSADAPHDAPHDAEWYQARWDELRDILSVSQDASVVARVQELQLDALQEQATVAADALGDDEAQSMLDRIRRQIGAIRERTSEWSTVRRQLNAESPQEASAIIEALNRRVEALEEKRSTLEEAGVRSVDQALAMIESMESQLQSLYEEKESTERAAATQAVLNETEDTFEQLQRLLSREERLQRELGVTSSEEVIEMVRGLADQLEELYRERDAALAGDGAGDRAGDRAGDGSPDDRLDELLRREERLKEKLGVSDPEQIAHMVDGLAEQLEELYAARERLARVNLDDAESVLQMISSMREQLELFYEEQERMASSGIDSIDQAVAMIESMQEQLSTVYDERQRLLDKGVGDTEEALQRIDALESKLDQLEREKNDLLARRDEMQSEMDDATRTVLEDELGTADPERVVSMINSMEDQLDEFYRQREEEEADKRAMNAPSVVDADTLRRLGSMSEDELDALSAGAIRTDDAGIVSYANDVAARVLPGVDGSDGSALPGRNFFFSVAPGANNNLFRGRFKQGVLDESLDVRFPYTFIHPTQPSANLIIHLYRTGLDANWILMRPLS
jgi:photoactive yellow protein